MTRNKISSLHEKNSVRITSHYGRNEMKFSFRGGQGKTAHLKNLSKPERDIETIMLKATMQVFIKEILR